MLKKLKKNKKAFMFILVIFICLLVILVTLLLPKDSSKKDKSTWISTSFNESQTISLLSKLPISDELGRNIDGLGTEKGIQGYLELTINNNVKKNVDYEIYLTKKDSSTIKNNYIKLYLTDKANNPVEGFEQNSVPTFNDLPTLLDLPSDRLLYRGKLKALETEKLYLRSWISDSYVVSNENDNFTFNVNVRAN